MFEKMSLSRILLRSLHAMVTTFAVAACQTAPVSAQAAAERLRPQIALQVGHSDGIESVAFSPDGRTALSGSFDKTLKLWDIESGRALRTFTGHSAYVKSVAFSPDGRTALSGSSDKTLKLWDVASGRLLRTFTGHSDNVTSVAFSPDGRTALSGSYDSTLRLWDVASGRLLRTFTEYDYLISSVAFSPDGRTALSGSITRRSGSGMWRAGDCSGLSPIILTGLVR